jgi:hypothetical protein
MVLWIYFAWILTSVIANRKLFFLLKIPVDRMGSCLWVFVLFMHSVKAYCWVLFFVDIDFFFRFIREDHWQKFSYVSDFTYMTFFKDYSLLMARSYVIVGSYIYLHTYTHMLYVWALIWIKILCMQKFIKF